MLITKSVEVDNEVNRCLIRYILTKLEIPVEEVNQLIKSIEQSVSQTYRAEAVYESTKPLWKSIHEQQFSS
jgi:hypothetical protein